MKTFTTLVLLLIANITFSQTLVGLTELQIKSVMHDFDYSCDSQINGYGEFLLPVGKSLVYDTEEFGIAKYHIITLNRNMICMQHIILLNKQTYHQLYAEFEETFKKINHSNFVQDGILYTFHADEDDDFYSLIQEKDKN